MKYIDDAYLARHEKIYALIGECALRNHASQAAGNITRAVHYAVRYTRLSRLADSHCMQAIAAYQE
ncbi:hypothetical protein EDF56_106363 [Novosphingobium sp. PhB165]|nr:hypothetical protein EDF56_106363 [Novosphingobium sp. PhB165]